MRISRSAVHRPIFTVMVVLIVLLVAFPPLALWLPSTMAG